MKLEKFTDVLSSIKNNNNRKFNLLVGNGFSMAYDPDIFSYNALHDFVTKTNDKDLSKILSVIETRNFEVIMQNLDSFSALVSAVSAFDSEDSALKQRIDVASKKLQESLIDAVKSLHPEHVFQIPEDESKACSKFLKVFLSSGGNIYSTNYDLLLYWVLMRSGHDLKHVDGCGRELENADEFPKEDEQIWSELIWGKNREHQNIFYLHGALPFFDTGVSIVKEEYNVYNYLLNFRV